MARKRSPKSDNPYGGIGFAPEVEIAAKKFTKEKDVSLKYLIRLATREYLSKQKDGQGKLYLL